MGESDARFLLGDLADFLIDAGDADQDGGLDGGAGLGQLVEGGAVGDWRLFGVERVVEWRAVMCERGRKEMQESVELKPNSGRDS